MISMMWFDLYWFGSFTNVKFMKRKANILMSPNLSKENIKVTYADGFFQATSKIN